MDIRQLRYFVVLAKELHFGRAAEKLGIAQPSLSAQVQALEASLGAQLLTRGPRAVTLTTAGAIFLEEARLTLAQADRAIAVGRRAGRGEIGTVRIGLALGSTLSGAPSIIIAQFRERFPDIDIQLSIMPPNRQIDGLRNRTIDVGFLLPPSSMPDDIEVIGLQFEKPAIALCADHPLARKPTLEAADLADEPFLVMHPESSNSIYEATIQLGKHGRFSPRITRIEYDLVALLSLVGAGFGVILVSEAVQRIAMPNVVFRPLVGFQANTEIAAAYRRDETAKPVRPLLQFCARYSSGGGAT